MHACTWLGQVFEAAPVLRVDNGLGIMLELSVDKSSSCRGADLRAYREALALFPSCLGVLTREFFITSLLNVLLQLQVVVALLHPAFMQSNNFFCCNEEALDTCLFAQCNLCWCPLFRPHLLTLCTQDTATSPICLMSACPSWTLHTKLVRVPCVAG